MFFLVFFSFSFCFFFYGLNCFTISFDISSHKKSVFEPSRGGYLLDFLFLLSPLPPPPPSSPTAHNFAFFPLPPHVFLSLSGVFSVDLSRPWPTHGARLPFSGVIMCKPRRREPRENPREREASTELHKEHHLRSAGLNQRLAEAERGELGGLIQRALTKQQDDEDRKNSNSNQLEDKEQAYLRKVNRAIFKANNGCPESSETDHNGMQTTNSRRRNDKDDPGKTPERRFA